MSVVSSRPRVRGVSLTSTAVSAALAASAGLATVLVRSLGAAALTAYREGSKAKEALEATTALDSVAEIERRQRGPVRVSSNELKPSEVLKVHAALLLGDYAVSDVNGLRSGWDALSRSRTLEQTRRASKALLETARDQHHELVVLSLTDACVAASRAAGFSDVHTRRRGGQIRVVATDPRGRALVTEIDPDSRGDLSLATEVVGVRDGSCHKILDCFDAALEAEGVIAGPPKRSPTGGVCQLDSAREAIRELYGAYRKPPKQRPVTQNAVADETQDGTLNRHRSRKRVSLRRRS